MTVCLSPNGRTVFSGQAPARQLLVGTVDGLFTLERQSSGEPWQVVRRGLQGLHISSLLLEPKRGGLFAGVHGSGLYASWDGGQSWEPKTGGLTCQHVYTLASRERNGEVVLYAGTEPAHLFQSRDYGETWEELPALRSVPSVERWTFPAPPHLGHVKNVTFHPRDSKAIFVSIEQGGLLKSTDEGRSWQELSGFDEDVHRLVMRPSQPEAMYITGGDGLYHRADGGSTWEHLTTRSMRIGYPDGLLLSPVDDRVMYMAGAISNPGSWRQSHTADAGVARSRDGGRNWEMLGRGFPERIHGNIEAMSIHVRPGSFAFFVATTDGDVYVSEDEGESWAQIAGGLAPVSKVGHYLNLR